jgi:hypothetical protein
LNGGTFNNNTGGLIRIDNSSGNGLRHVNGTFANAATITIGAVVMGSIGLYNNAAFNNNTGGLIRIDNSSEFGLVNNRDGTFTNAAAITIGAAASVGSIGLYNYYTFNNNTGGQISIDHSTQFGLRSSNGTFTNSSTITIGAAAGVGDYGLSNEATFNNSTCAALALFAPLSNTNTFNNQGLFTVNTALAHTNFGFTNDGIIDYPQGNPIPAVTNNDVIIVPTSTCSTPALQIGGSSQFTVGTTWYKEAALTTAAGTYNATTNTFQATALAAGSTYTLYFSIADPSNGGCTQTVSIAVAVTPTTVWYLDAMGMGTIQERALLLVRLRAPGIGVQD